MEKANNSSNSTNNKLQIKQTALEQKVGKHLLESVNWTNIDNVKNIVTGGGTNINYQNVFLLSALMLAARKGKSEILDFLITEGADLNLQDVNGNTALLLAIQTKESEIEKISIAKKLINAGPDLKLCNNQGFTPLILASSLNEVRIVELLINKGADSNLRTKDGFTALMHACSNGNEEIVNLLINKSANLDLDVRGGVNNTTAIMMATDEGLTGIVKLLINAGANANLLTTHGYSPLMVSIDKEYNAIAELLITTKGVDLNLLTNKKNSTALFIAITKKSEKIVESLINAGAHVNIKDVIGCTPLSIAIMGGNKKIITLLFQAKADYTTLTKDLVNKAFDTLQDSKQSEVLNFLEGHKKELNKIYKEWFKSLDQNTKFELKELLKSNPDLNNRLVLANTLTAKNILLNKARNDLIAKNKPQKEESKHQEEESKHQDDNNRSKGEVRNNFSGKPENKPQNNTQKLKALVINCVVNACKTLEPKLKNELADDIIHILTAQHKTSVHTLNALKELCVLKQLTTEKTNSLLQNLESKSLLNYNDLCCEKDLVKIINDIIDLCLKFNFRYKNNSSYAELIDKFSETAKGLLHLHSELDSFIKREENQFSKKAKLALQNYCDKMFDVDETSKTQKEHKSTQQTKSIKKKPIRYDQNPQNDPAKEQEEENQPNTDERQIVVENSAIDFENDDNDSNPQDVNVYTIGVDSEWKE